MSDKFEKPCKNIPTDAFFGSVSSLMPRREDIPIEFRFPGDGHWSDVFNDLFFNTVKVESFAMQDGIDEQDAIRHIRYIMRSFEPSHEHKEEACAYLMSKWFKEIKYSIVEKNS